MYLVYQPFGFLLTEFLFFTAFVYFSTQVSMSVLFIWMKECPFWVKSSQSYFWTLPLWDLDSPQPGLYPRHILATWFDFLAVLEPLEGKVWVADLYHQLDLVASVHLVGWIQLLCEGWRWRDVSGTELRCSQCSEPSRLPPQATKVKNPLMNLEAPENRALCYFSEWDLPKISPGSDHWLPTMLESPWGGPFSPQTSTDLRSS